MNNLVRKSIQKIKPYSSARDEYKGLEGIFLDANESPFGDLNRYPDPHQKKLKTELSKIKSISENAIFIGNGSDEVIDLVFRIFCEPGKDKALIFQPTYGMYEVSAAINDVDLIKVPLNENFQIDFDNANFYMNNPSLKLILICSPNNPTGNSIDGIENILNTFNGIVLVDEAYIDFSDNVSLLQKVTTYPNLIVAQTFSKAYGLAAARIGVAYANPDIITWFNKVKPPYNVSELNQQAALNALQNRTKVLSQIELIKREKKKLIQNLSELNIVKKIYPSDANFLLVEFDDADSRYNQLVKVKIITRNRNSVVKNCIRITIGSSEENEKLINVLKNSLT